VICDVDDWQPQQIHLSLGANPSQMIVTWLTTNKTNERPICYYGEEKLTKQQLGSEKEFIDDGFHKIKRYIQRVTLTDLVSGNTYRYYCGSSLGWSSIYWFEALRTDKDFQPKIAVFGDLGTVNGQSIPRLQQHVHSGDFDAIIHNGDFAYNLDDENGNRGDEFMRQIEPFAAYVPYQTSVGNHENAYNFSHYDNRFTMINSGGEHSNGVHNNHFYSFNIGKAHIISFSTEYYFYVEYGWNQIANQYNWLKKDLEEANRNRDKQPWIITFGHRPMYCSDDYRDDCSHKESLIRKGLPIIKAYGLEDLFYKYGVDIEIYAHEHIYERFWPVYDRKVYNGSLEHPYTNPRAPVHFISGSAGCQERVDSFIPDPPEWSALRISDYGFASLHVLNDTHVHIEQISDDQNGTVVDDFWVIKDHHGPYELFDQVNIH